MTDDEDLANMLSSVLPKRKARNKYDKNFFKDIRQANDPSFSITMNEPSDNSQEHSYFPSSARLMRASQSLRRNSGLASGVRASTDSKGNININLNLHTSISKDKKNSRLDELSELQISN